jgi:hypothetical protein
MPRLYPRSLEFVILVILRFPISNHQITKSRNHEIPRPNLLPHKHNFRLLSRFTPLGFWPGFI